MFQASKRLQDIRRQLREMDKCYRQYSDRTEDELLSEDTASLTSRENTYTENTKVPQDNHSCLTTLHIPAKNEILSLPSDSSPDQKVLSIASEDGNSTRFMQNDSMVEGSSLAVNDASIKESQASPQTQELECAILAMEDLDDVDSFIDDVLPIDPCHDDDLLSFEQSFTRAEESISEGAERFFDLTNIQFNSLRNNTDSVFLSTEDKQKWLKDRQKKDNHNKVERRRRYNINDRINELANLLPPSAHLDTKLNKGSILTATVEYIKDLKRDKCRLKHVEAQQLYMDSKYKKMLIRIFKLELQMKLYGLSEELGQSKSKKKRPNKSSLKEIDNIVELLLEKRIPRKSKRKGLGKIETKMKGQKKEANINKGLRSLLENPLPEDLKNDFGQDNNIFQTNDGKSSAVNDDYLFQKRQVKDTNDKNTISTRQTLSQNNETSQSDIETIDHSQLLDFLNIENITDIIIFPSNEQSSEPEELNASISPTTTMLENLLRNSRLNSLSDSSGVDSSMESSSDLL